MNMMSGRFGKQEACAACVNAILASCFFAVDSSSAYSKGNVIVLSSILAFLLSFLFILAIQRLLVKHDVQDLFSLMDRTLGRFVSVILCLFFDALFVFMSSAPVSNALLSLKASIYTENNFYDLLTYFLPCVAIPILLGAEAIVRTCRVLVIPNIVITLIAVILAGQSYHIYNLFPVLGAGASEIAFQTLMSLLRILPAILALLVLGGSLQGIKNTIYCCKFSIIVGGLFVVIGELCLGLAYNYNQLSNLAFPFVNLTTAVRYSQQPLRFDRVAMFIWLLSTFLTTVYYCFSAASLLVKGFGIRDIRPTALMCAGAAVSVCYLMASGKSHDQNEFESIATFGAYALIGILLLIMLVGAITQRRNEKCAKACA